MSVTLEEERKRNSVKIIGRLLRLHNVTQPTYPPKVTFNISGLATEYTD